VLSSAACQVGDPLSEAVCWNGFWLLVTSGEVRAAQFTDMVSRRLGSDGLPDEAVEALLGRAVEAADLWAPPAARAGLREQVAAAARNALTDGQHNPALAAGSAASALGAGFAASALAAGFAASAQTGGQLALLEAWLAGQDLPDEVVLDAGLRARILFALAASGRARDQDIDALPLLDPVTGAAHRATCLAMRPARDAKQEAWEAALAPDTSAGMARAYATGFWVPGQEELVDEYRDRYFSEALAELAGKSLRTKMRLSRLLFPATLVTEATIEAAEACQIEDDVLRDAVTEQAAIMRDRLTARQQA
jgi:aminopeptidase N